MKKVSRSEYDAYKAWGIENIRIHVTDLGAVEQVREMEDGDLVAMWVKHPGTCWVDHDELIEMEMALEEEQDCDPENVV